MAKFGCANVFRSNEFRKTNTSFDTLHFLEDGDCSERPASSQQLVLNEQPADPDSCYDKHGPRAKVGITAIIALCSFLAPISATTIMSATPEVASEYAVSGMTINFSHALFKFMLALGPLLWASLSQVYGRRLVTLFATFTFCVFSAGTAVANNLPCYFAIRILCGISASSFIVIGSACMSDIRRPTERGRGIAWVQAGQVVGPAIGPFLGGVLVTHHSWRAIFWVHAAFGGSTMILAFFFLPETIHHKKSDDLTRYSGKAWAIRLLKMLNPVRVFHLFRYRSLVLVAVASSTVTWNMYSMLSSIRYVLNPRFGLKTPTEAGLFYLAPGLGYAVGCLIGGPLSDHTVKKWVKRRCGTRVPEDRLCSAWLSLGVIMPTSMLIYGWVVQTNAGGNTKAAMAVTCIALFSQGMAQIICLSSLNTYCLDFLQDRSAEVSAGNYFARFTSAAVATLIVLPLESAAGIGWFSTISSVLLVIGGCCLLVNIKYGAGWRDAIDGTNEEKEVIKGRQ